MKATEQYFPVVLFIMLYKLVLAFQFVDEILKCALSNKLYFPAVLFIPLVGLKSGNKIQYVPVKGAVQDGSNYYVCG